MWLVVHTLSPKHEVKSTPSCGLPSKMFQISSVTAFNHLACWVQHEDLGLDSRNIFWRYRKISKIAPKIESRCYFLCTINAYRRFLTYCRISANTLEIGSMSSLYWLLFFLFPLFRFFKFIVLDRPTVCQFSWESLTWKFFNAFLWSVTLFFEVVNAVPYFWGR